MAKDESNTKRPHRPFRRAVLRGMGVILPPLLTIVFLLWIWNSVQTYVLSPIEGLARQVIVNRISNVHDSPPETASVIPYGSTRAFREDDKTFVELPSGQWIPGNIRDSVLESPGPSLPTTAESFYERYVESQILRPAYVLPFVFCLFILLVYLLGKFIAARVGKLFVRTLERVIDQLPIIRTVYGTFKQVTDIAFNDQEIEFTRAVAIEYPRKGLWSIGFVTGESMPAIADIAAEPVLSILMPTSPAPFTGFTVTIRKSETIELDITRDQAFQFVVSCGVVVPGLKNRPEDVKQIVNQAVAANSPTISNLSQSLPSS